jgi:phosphatidylserine/phosphatidylglycerophosphate/cardiolipin synthase-like enzyme
MHNMLRRRNRQRDGSYDDVVSQLVRLHKGGCSVKVLISYNPKTKRARIQGTARDALQQAGITINTAELPLHDKAILVKARWGNDGAPSHHVLTGSHNITIDALRNNDELLLVLGHNQSAYNAFEQHFATAWNPH